MNRMRYDHKDSYPLQGNDMAIVYSGTPLADRRSEPNLQFNPSFMNKLQFIINLVILLKK